MVASVAQITADGFQKDVVEVSATTPVLLDFWADWCEPCRTLGPRLEALAEEYGGSFRLGTVDTEQEQDLAYAFGVQGIPFCVLIVKGRPVDGFQGALPEAEVRQFLKRNGIEPAAKAEAEPAPIDPNGPEARLARATVAVAEGDVAAAREALEDFPEDEEESDAALRLASGIDWLDATLDAAAGPAEEKLLAARQRFLARDYGSAMESILDSVALDK
ncbi:MAG: co-chaperone YbbN, partial [Planctomycetes bacterium]|nr:co-chaperone YbbN [Planctomycetota bacterium]